MRQRLAATLTVNLGGTDHTIPGGNVRAIELVMTSHGVTGSVSFLVQDDQDFSGKYKDEVLADFKKSDLGTVTISVGPAYWDTSTAKTVPPIATSGIILDKSVSERLYEVGFEGDAPILHRTYTLRFADPAWVLWREHFPVDLFTSKAFKDVIEAHKGDKITLTYDFTPITTSLPLVFFALDPARGASFYDLVLWFVRHQNGVFSYDHAAGTYSVKTAKDTSGTASTLARDEVASLSTFYAEVTRHTPRVKNSYTESTANKPAENASAATGIYRDVLLRSPIAADVDDRVTLESARPLTPGPVVDLSFRAMPTVAMTPGSLVDISASGGFPTTFAAGAGTYRVIELSLAARSPEALPAHAENDYGDTATAFDIDLVAKLELKDETTLRFPAITPPHFPGYLEGKVVSEVGEDDEITYQIYQNETTSLDEYHVKIPLFEDQIVNAPFEPYRGSGTMYVPVYKNARVLVAFDFDKAWITRLLDSRPGAPVPMDGQGDHLLFGKTTTNSTSIMHDYQDDKPVLQIKRTNDKDTAILRIEEGKMTLQVKETEGS